VAIAEHVAQSVTVLFAVDTLEYLQKGGRIGKAQALLASVLSIKPILTLREGEVHPYKKIRGTNRVYQEMVETLKQADPGKPLHLGLAHASNTQALQVVEGLIDASGIKYESLLTSEIGPVIGTYTGPGAFAMVFYQE
jgi:DegV family protein with EDD domain